MIATIQEYLITCFTTYYLLTLFHFSLALVNVHNYLERNSNEKMGGEGGRIEKIKFLGKSGPTFLTAKLSSSATSCLTCYPRCCDCRCYCNFNSDYAPPPWPGIRGSPNWVSATYVIPELKVTVRFAVRN